MGRKEDLERNIRASYELICKYEERIRLTDDLQAQERYELQRDEQWKLIQGWLDQYVPLCQRLGLVVPDDIVEIALHFPEYAELVSQPYFAAEQALTWLPDEAKPLVAEIFDELETSVGSFFENAIVGDISTVRRKLNMIRTRIEELGKIGVEKRSTRALEYFIRALECLFEGYQCAIRQSEMVDFNEVLAMHLDSAAANFTQTNTRVGQAFGTFMRGWSLIKRTKPLYADPSKLGEVIKRHKEKIPEILQASGDEFLNHPMGAFAQGEANYSLGWGYVFEAFSRSDSMEQAELLNLAAHSFGQAAECYKKAKVDPVHESLAKADSRFFRALIYILLSQREAMTLQMRIDNLQEASRLLRQAGALFLGIRRIELCISVLKFAWIVEKELTSLQGRPFPEHEAFLNITKNIYVEAERPLDLIDEKSLREQASRMINFQALTRISETLLNSNIFIEAISIIRKDDVGDLRDVIDQVTHSSGLVLSQTGEGSA